MDYHFYNTDGKSLAGLRPRFHTLIKNDFAATGGNRSFGEQLDQLAPRDVLLMYENGIGVVAVGNVLERWDRKSHIDLLYYDPNNREKEIGAEGHEYRIKVKWFDLSGHPIGIPELKQQLG